MKAHRYDIVRKDNRHSMWLEDAEDLDSAESRIRFKSLIKTAIGSLRPEELRNTPGPGINSNV
jgi:hypothetical protein